MSVTFTPEKKYTLPGGLLVEEGSWVDDGLAAPSGTWTADNTVLTYEGQIQKVTTYNFADDNLAALDSELFYNQPGNAIQILVQPNATGRYIVQGFQA